MVRKIIYIRPLLATKVQQLTHYNHIKAFRELNAECSGLHWLQMFCSSFHQKVGFITLHLESGLALWFALTSGIGWMWYCWSWDWTSKGLASFIPAFCNALVTRTTWASHLEDHTPGGERNQAGPASPAEAPDVYVSPANTTWNRDKLVQLSPA